ncbi:MAG: Fe-S-cluster-containing dehydrogenase component [Candidatus Methanohalarchaeum thermophilum]|uniref:Fe-S-cluster-containing dehydrogenase component n=1 Tax=Methanohalarchaeum thermophilum TaxID=1903181 RepID=A0A1Q6DWE9_METT1|nr:MAG: Fe-S-cluster-containing dehydrogenase component [Candidatus Methanohalarchaeum thermophilum]
MVIYDFLVKMDKENVSNMDNEGFKETGSKFTRRKLLKAVAVGGAVAAVGVSGCTQGGTVKYACPYCDKEFDSESALKDHIEGSHPDYAKEMEIPKSGVIKWNPEQCFGGERCVTACCTEKQGKVAFHLSCIKWKEDYLDGYEREPLLCNQCDYPECYYACPIEGAMYIDEETGARCIDEEKCTGCKECIEACPFDPPRISFDPNREVAVKCDLCSDRIKEGEEPACVETCSETGGGKALVYVPKEER